MSKLGDKNAFPYKPTSATGITLREYYIGQMLSNGEMWKGISLQNFIDTIIDTVDELLETMEKYDN